jgi:hypothetical protein
MAKQHNVGQAGSLRPIVNRPPCDERKAARGRLPACPTLALLLLVPAAWAGIWPDQFGAAQRVSAKPVTLSDQKLWSEYGFQESEQAQYEAGAEKFTATAYRLQDSTAALGAFEWQRPKNGEPSQLGKLAVETLTETLLAHGNYLLVFQGVKPRPADLEPLLQRLPKLDQAPLPSLPSNLPSAGLVRNSERYIVGPLGLEAFYPGIPASVAAFHVGSEAQIGTFRQAGGEMKLAIFSFPTPNIARDRLAEMQKLPGAVAKRSGPLVAVILSPPNADDAERLLSQVRYQASISWSQYVPSRRDNIGDLVINAFILIGVLLAFSTTAGLAFGGLRLLAKRSRKGDPDAMIVLHLHDQ